MVAVAFSTTGSYSLIYKVLSTVGRVGGLALVGAKIRSQVELVRRRGFHGVLDGIPVLYVRKGTTASIVEKGRGRTAEPPSRSEPQLDIGCCDEPTQLRPTAP